MPTKLLKEILDTVLPIITKIINSSLEQGTFAARWKTAIIRPLIKKAGLDLTANNYRPVSNLPFLSKVLEKAALIQLMEHCKKNDLIPDYQSAYRPHYSCETALVKLMNDLLWAMEYQEVTALMAIDLSAAFDTVDHDILVSVLKAKFGIEGRALNWFDSYLRQRSYKVNVCRAYSEHKYLPFSVPQGSCAGPVLYILYASTMQEVIGNKVDLHGYADDHALKIQFLPTKNENIAISTLEKFSKEIKSWMDSNRLKMNTSKTEFILFGSKHQLKKCQTNHLLVDQDNIKRSTKIKYLGVYLDEYLTLKEQIKMKCKSAMWHLQRIKSIRTILTKESCETLIVGLVLSQLDYANCLFIGLPECDLQKLQRVQNIAAKIVLKSEENSITCLKILHWLPISLRIKYKVLIMLYKSLHGLSPHYIREMVEFHTPERTGLRSDNIFQLLKVPNLKRKTFAARSYSVAAPMWWNELPNSIKLAGNIDIFKTKLKTYFFDLF